ncbi:MAG TPA: hypothetical protein HA263_06450 [Methanoregulaceae archaeon]|nr:hypothetical protein [Methanoregulaceae archaeon]
MVNAVCHRDYTLSSPVEIRVHEDRIDGRSPEGMPHGITLVELSRPHRSVLRNIGIATVFYELALVERWGAGTKECRRQGRMRECLCLCSVRNRDASSPSAQIS